MDKRGAVQEFHCSGGSFGQCRLISTAGLGDREGQSGPDPRTAGEYGVADRSRQERRPSVRLGPAHGRFKRPFDSLSNVQVGLRSRHGCHRQSTIVLSILLDTWYH